MRFYLPKNVKNRPFSYFFGHSGYLFPAPGFLRHFQHNITQRLFQILSGSAIFYIFNN